MGNVVAGFERCLSGQSSEHCDACNGTGVCPSCGGEGGAVKELNVTRTEWAKNAEERMVQQVTSVLQHENVPCSKCMRDVRYIQMNANNRSPSPFHKGSQKADLTHLSKFVKENKPLGLATGLDAWRGSGKCSRCKGAGVIVRFASPLARQLAFEDS